jgi:predicted outer membrane protein
MIGDHTSVNGQALALLKKLNVKPEGNPTSQSLTEAADAERKKLVSPALEPSNGLCNFARKRTTRCPGKVR